MAREIIDLHGNIFEVIKGWEFSQKVPTFDNYTYIFTQDIITKLPFILALSNVNNTAYGYFPSKFYGLYIVYPMIKRGYDESKDIRKAYLYGKKH